MFTKRVADRVYLLDTLALGTPGIVSAYAITGPKPALVDCGYATSYQNVLAGLAEIGLMPSDIRYVIPTHVHLDHAGAAGHLMKSMPNAEMIVHEKGAPHLVDPTRLIESATKVFGKTVMELYGPPLPVPSERITSAGKELHLELGGGMSATLIHTPGHAPHQLSVLLDHEKLLLTADAVGIVYPEVKTLIPTTPPPSFEPQTLVHSVGELEQATPRALLAPHFGTREDTSRVFEDTRSKVIQWITEVKGMKAKGLAQEEIASEMSAEVRKESGLSDLPIYARVSVRTSVMGILHYLEKNP
jgi:glyoxylase-like metal-dependent hydrolase (beta-lactamase superfamily II)